MKIVGALIFATACSSNTMLTGAMFTTNLEITCDSAGTIYSSDNGQWDRKIDAHHVQMELNPLLGSKPSVNTLEFVWAADVIVNTTVRLLPVPSWAKWVWYGAVGLVEARMIHDNNQFSYCGSPR